MPGRDNVQRRARSTSLVLRCSMCTNCTSTYRRLTAAAPHRGTHQSAGPLSLHRLFRDRLTLAASAPPSSGLSGHPRALCSAPPCALHLRLHSIDAACCCTSGRCSTLQTKAPGRRLRHGLAVFTRKLARSICSSRSPSQARLASSLPAAARRTHLSQPLYATPTPPCLLAPRPLSSTLSIATCTTTECSSGPRSSSLFAKLQGIAWVFYFILLHPKLQGVAWAPYVQAGVYWYALRPRNPTGVLSH